MRKRLADYRHTQVEGAAPAHSTLQDVVFPVFGSKIVRKNPSPPSTGIALLILYTVKKGVAAVTEDASIAQRVVPRRNERIVSTNGRVGIQKCLRR